MGVYDWICAVVMGGPVVAIFFEERKHRKAVKEAGF